MPRESTNARDAALHRLRRLNRWMIGGSVALTAVFGEIAASAFPGKTVKVGGSSKAKAGRTGGASTKTSTAPVKPPVQPPTATPESATPESSTHEPAPAQESSPSGEAGASQEAPANESAPSRESAPAQESTPSTESPPARETAPTPAPEQSAPVVSGGS